MAGNKDGKTSHTHSNAKAKPNAMTPQEAGAQPHRHGMSREEAGHKGGIAHHECRGFQCQEKRSKK